MIQFSIRENTMPDERFGSTPIAASRVIDIIDRTFRVYRENFVAFVALVALVSVPITLLDLFARGGQTVDDLAYYDNAGEWLLDWMAANIGSVALWVTSELMLHIFTFGVIAYMTSENNLGRKVSVIAALRATSRKFFKLALAWMVIIFALIVLAVSMIFSGAMFILPWLFFPAVFFYGLCAYVFVVPVIILEDVPLLTSVVRAVTLAKMRFWRMFGFAIGLWLITWVVSIAFGFFTEFLLGAASSRSVILVTINALIDMLTTPVLPVGLTLLYYDARIRVEGLDIALRLTPSPEPQLSDVISPRPGESIVVTRDVRNIVIFTVALGVLSCSLFGLLAIVGAALT